MLGRIVMPRWRLPGWILVGMLLSGCAARNEQGGSSSLSLPSMRMALVKIPLRGPTRDVLRDQDPIERFKPEPVAVAQVPRW